MEHRWGERTSVNLTVRLTGLPGAIGMGRLRDVSLSGAFVETELNLLPLSPVHIERIAGICPTSHHCEGRAYVVRRISAGVGIEWFAAALDPVPRISAILTAGDFLEDSNAMAREASHP